ncbi:EAL domain-containing protein [Propionivibrio sp.]|uniref:bifunctional diguanylate cyclase/phosphodiesterase n=1 Tax=Propionivibrio sp. TaxID=2212460 RepID=UPI003BF08B3E
MLAENSSALAEALKRCESEPIQFIGAIQNHGVLLATDKHSTIRVASGNLQEILGISATEALNQPAARIFGEEAWAAILALQITGKQPLSLALRLKHGEALVEHQAQAHYASDMLIVEIEAGNAIPELARPIDFDSTNTLLNALLADVTGIEAYAAVISDQVQKLTGYDRVMVYQFDNQWNGQIIAESLKGGMTSFMGNHFPASDIPPPARELYTKNLVRILVDRDAPVIPLFQPPDLSLDLSFSVLRSMSPIHLEYLRNLGVRATLTVSLLQNGRLWGLIACHHEQPRQLPPNLRQSMELVAKTVATRLAAIAFVESSRYYAMVRDLLPRLVGLVQDAPGASILAQDLQQEVLGLVHASGAVIATGKLAVPIGTIPNVTQIESLLAWLRPRLAGSMIFATHALAVEYPPAASFSGIASGLLAISLDDSAEQFLLWFREEVVRSIPWAGEAAKYLVEDERGPKLEPRRSFELWVQTQRGESAPWSEPEVDAARMLSVTLAELFARQQLKMAEESKRLAASVYENSSEAMVVTDANNVILDVNPAFTLLTGYSASEAIGQTPGILNSGRHDEAFYQSMWQSLKDTGVWCGEIWNRRKNGEIYPERLTINTIFDESGTVHRRVALFNDITERKQIETDLRVAATAFESQEGMTITDTNGAILRVNKAFTRITGYSAEEVVGQNPRLRNSGRQDTAFYAAMWESIVNTGSWQGEIWNRRKNGEAYPEWLSVTAVKGEDGRVTHFVGTFTDITERKAAADKIEHLAFYDHLTQLPNRRLMLDRLEQALIGCARRNRQGALMLIDLDNFKTLNDTLGHAVGDRLLVEAACRLESCIRADDTVARLGGDEFVVILEGLEEGKQAAVQAEGVAAKILTSLGQPYLLDVTLNGEEPRKCSHQCTSSIGITLFRDHTISVDELVKRADTAMYQAKSAGRNTLRFFDPEMQAAVKARAALELDLRKALEEVQFLLYYQAQVDASGRVTGAEALVRWQHPERGLVYPGEFIPLTEDTGLILPLGYWVLETACAQLAAWASQPDKAHLTLAVNVSARQFSLPNFVELVLAAIEHTGARPDKLKLELTESLLLENAEDIILKMNALKARGVGFSLDDFGTGYSSLSYLKRLPLDQLKIDQSFVSDLLTDPKDAAIARTVVTLGHSLGLTVIAEGVETAAQKDFLASLGCLAYQGYFFSRPLPLDGFEAFLKLG